MQMPRPTGGPRQSPKPNVPTGANPDEPAPLRTVGPTEITASGPIRLLIVEDREADAELVLLALEQSGVAVSWTRVDTEAAFLQALESTPDLILADYSLPAFGAPRALELLRARGLSIPLIVVSGTIGEDQAAATIKQGAADYLLKDRLARIGSAVQSAIRQHRLAAAEQLAQAQLVQQERLRAMGEMASGIAHDFNNALSLIYGFTEIILERPELLDNRERTLSYIQSMHVAARDATEIVRRLRLFYARDGDGAPEQAVDLPGVVTQAIALTEPRWKQQRLAEGITVDIQTRLEAVPSVAGNESELRDVLTNLIFNAVDALPRGGAIVIETRLVPDWALLRVTDNGTGMPEDVRRRCFEPFYSTKGSGGTGLGLATVLGTVQRNGGRIEVDSEPGRGTSFSLYLRPWTASAPASGASDDGAAYAPARILLVDDDDRVRPVIAELLMSDGHLVVTAASGDDALARFDAEPFDLVITDLAMPQMTGADLAQAVKLRSATTPVIMLTGFGETVQLWDELPTGVDRIVSKPATRQVLKQAIAGVMRGPGGPSGHDQALAGPAPATGCAVSST